MMKKEYVKPETAVENVMVETMLASSQGPQGPSLGGGDVSGEPKEANNRRGGWGNLWD